MAVCLIARLAGKNVAAQGCTIDRETLAKCRVFVFGSDHKRSIRRDSIFRRGRPNRRVDAEMARGGVLIFIAASAGVIELVRAEQECTEEPVTGNMAA